MAMYCTLKYFLGYLKSFSLYNLFPHNPNILFKEVNKKNNLWVFSVYKFFFTKLSETFFLFFFLKSTTKEMRVLIFLVMPGIIKSLRIWGLFV